MAFALRTPLHFEFAPNQLSTLAFRAFGQVRKICEQPDDQSRQHHANDGNSSIHVSLKTGVTSHRQVMSERHAIQYLADSTLEPVFALSDDSMARAKLLAGPHVRDNAIPCRWTLRLHSS